MRQKFCGSCTDISYNNRPTIPYLFYQIFLLMMIYIETNALSLLLILNFHTTLFFFSRRRSSQPLFYLAWTILGWACLSSLLFFSLWLPIS